MLENKIFITRSLTTIIVSSLLVIGFVSLDDSQSLAAYTGNHSVIATISVGDDGPYGVAVSPDDSIVLTANSGGTSVGVISADSNTYETSAGLGHIGDPMDVVFSPTSSLAYAASYTAGAIYSVGSTSPYPYTGVGTGFGMVTALAMSPDGAILYASDIQTNRLWAIPVDDPSSALSVSLAGAVPFGVAVAPDGDYVYVALFATNELAKIRVSDFAVTTVSVGSSPAEVALSADGAIAYVSNSGDNRVSVVDTSTLAVVTTFPTRDAPLGIALSPSGDVVYVANSGDDSVSVISLTSYTELEEIVVGDDPRGIAVNSSGSRIYVTNFADDTVSVIERAFVPEPVSSTDDESPGPAGIFLTVFGSVGDRLYGTDVLFGSYAIA
ncbi:MAG: beta-propeller fold lactonase family protein, partial [Pontimonas sp.]